VNGGSFADMTSEGSHRFGYQLTGDQLRSGTLSFEIRAGDDSGHVTTINPAGIDVVV